ncbi:MAG TPA: NUDIX domain-containing protein [Blastocatellia bacterium]|nr:NUDIX domain-containing protein [Blastocatellia bacterium]
MSTIPTRVQISAGGVAFRKRGRAIEVAIINVGKANRWQLPKGLVDRNESTEAAALREVREEAGIETSLVELIDKIEYWYVSKDRGRRVRFHKFVYLYLLRYESGDVRDHDHEVNEARWVKISEAIEMLAFASEKRVVERAREMIAGVKCRESRGRKG